MGDRDYNLQMGDLLEDGSCPEDAANFHELRNALDDAMHFALEPSERDVLRLRLGCASLLKRVQITLCRLDDGGRRTRIEVGRMFGADVKDVRLIERVALKN